MDKTALATIQEVDALLPTIEVLKNMKQVADYMVSAKMLPPGYKGGEDLMVVGLRGRELGVPLGQAIQGMFPMKGRIGYMGGFLSSMVKNRLPNSDIRIKLSTKEICVLEWKRTKEDEYQTEEYSMEEVIACHYHENPVWDNATDKQKCDASGHPIWKPKQPWGDPKNMLYWRCLTRTINRWFSDVFGSPVYTADEIQDMDIIDITPAGKAAASVPYATKSNTPENPELDKVSSSVEGYKPPSAPVVTEIEEVVTVPETPVVPGTEFVTEGPVEIEVESKPSKMNTAVVDALVLQFEKDLALCASKKDVDEVFNKFKTCGVGGKTLTTAFHASKKRKEELAVKK